MRCKLVVLLCLLAGGAHAQRALSVNGDLGVGALGGISQTTLQSGLRVAEGGLLIDLHGRVRLPMEGDDRVRARDWDEATDYVHILRQLRYQRRFERIGVDFRAGELLGSTLGHGTMMRDYSNIADPDHPHPGIQLVLDHRSFDLSLMVDNFVNPSVIAGRFALSPISSLHLGSSLVLDPRAPVQVRVDDSGVRQVDSAHNLISDDTVLGMVGLDAEYRIGRDDRYLRPYTDLNIATHNRGAGVGVHAGMSGKAPLGDTGVDIAAQAEYSFSGPGYQANYFGTFHDLERYQAGLTDADPAQAQTQLNAMVSGDGGHGLLAQLGLQAGHRVKLKVGFSHTPGPDQNRLWVRASTRPIDRLDIGSLLILRGLGQSNGSRGVAALAEARLRVTDYIYGLLQYTRRWYLSDDSHTYGLLQSFNVAFGGTWSG